MTKENKWRQRKLKKKEKKEKKKKHKKEEKMKKEKKTKKKKDGLQMAVYNFWNLFPSVICSKTY